MNELHRAAAIGHVNDIRRFVHLGVNKQLDNGLTALHIAAYYGRPEVVEVLLDNGADINIKDNDAEHHRCAQHINDGSIPLHEVAKQHNNIMINGLIRAAEILLAKGSDINMKDYNGRTPLYVAVCNQFLAMVQMLLRNGANVNEKNKHGWTPLYLAIVNGNIEIIKTLLDYGANANEKTSDGWAPLMLTKDKEIIELLTNYNDVMEIKEPDI